MLQTNSTAKAIEMLSKPIEAVNRILICLTRASSQLRPIPNLAWSSKQSFGLRLHQTLLERGEASLMISYGALNPVRAETMGFFEKEGLGEHAEEGGERIKRLSHVVLQILRCTLGPKQDANDIGNEGADDHNEGNLEKRVDPAFFDDTKSGVHEYEALL